MSQMESRADDVSFSLVRGDPWFRVQRAIGLISTNRIGHHEVVAGIRPTPIGKRALLAIVVPALFPMIPVFALQIPVKEVFLKLLKALL